MPNLPGSTPELDDEMFDTIINNPNYDCDSWKLYPTSVTTTSERDQSKFIQLLKNGIMKVNIFNVMIKN